jgi:surface antigen
MKPTNILPLLLFTATTALAFPANQDVKPTLDLSTRNSLIPRSGDDYPYKNSCNTAHDIDPWNFYKCECTSFVAWRINSVLGIKFTNQYKKQHWGNAELWDNAARASGVKINKTPKKNAVAQTDKSGSGLGHVAWVKSVSKDGKKVTVEEYNYHKDKYGVRTVDKGEFQNYIHL